MRWKEKEERWRDGKGQGGKERNPRRVILRSYRSSRNPELFYLLFCYFYFIKCVMWIQSRIQCVYNTRTLRSASAPIASDGVGWIILPKGIFIGRECMQKLGHCYKGADFFAFVGFNLDAILSTHLKNNRTRVASILRLFYFLNLK